MAIDLQRVNELVKVTSEAARLHVMMEKHASREVVAAALVWRWKELDRYSAHCIYDRAVELLDAMPKK